jgi:hypothetical protein
MGFGEIELYGMDWIDLVQINDQREALINIVVNL